jgi:hydrogenase nickel incorporation protein HypB
MCATCGCSSADPHASDDHDHAHPHEHHEHPRVVSLEADVLAKNDRMAHRNRTWLESRGVLALNFVSSPGAGKTTLIEKTIGNLRGEMDVAVIEGDQATSLDADRIRRTGARAVQVNTGTGCHLDAAMVNHALPALELRRGSLLVIENVGNLVCPALFDLGERAKVVVTSVTEGEDKPLKYPHMFRASELVLMNKMDLAGHVGFDRRRFDHGLTEVNPRARVIAVSAARGDGMGEWADWLRTIAR